MKMNIETKWNDRFKFKLKVSMAEIHFALISVLSI